MEPNENGGNGMKWMIASDLHGSAYYGKKMVEAFERELSLIHISEPTRP